MRSAELAVTVDTKHLPETLESKLVGQQYSCRFASSPFFFRSQHPFLACSGSPKSLFGFLEGGGVIVPDLCGRRKESRVIGRRRVIGRCVLGGCAIGRRVIGPRSVIGRIARGQPAGWLR